MGSTTKRDGWGDLTFGSDDQQSREKLRELVLYIADRCEEDQRFSAVKLNKILFYADFLSFAKYGESVTGVQYKKYPQGPVPTVLKRVRSEMEESGESVLRKKDYHGIAQHRVIPLRDSNLNKFSARDIALVDKVIERLWNDNATQVSAMSHDRAWRNSENGEPIPYEAVFVSDEPLTEQDIAIGHEMIDEFKRAKQSGL